MTSKTCLSVDIAASTMKAGPGGGWIVAAMIGLVCGIVVCACATGLAPRPVQSTVPPVPGGNLLLIGGGKKPPAVLELFIKLAGGGTKPIVVFPLASEDAEEAGDFYVELFREYGASKVNVLHVRDRRDGNRQGYIDAVRAAGGVFFTGGDQKRIGAWLVGTPLHDAVREMRLAGGVVAGTSAGTACQSDIMLTGDEGAEDVMRAGNIPVAQGLGLFEGVIVDQHFVARRRHNRLLSVVLEHPGSVGVGIDEAAAAWVKPDGTFEVVGDGWVFVYDSSRAEAGQGPNRKLFATGVQLHVLVAGQSFDVKNRQAIVAAKY